MIGAAGSAPDPYSTPEYPGVPSGWRHIQGRAQQSSIIISPLLTKTIIVGGQSNHATTGGSGSYSTVSANAQQLNIYDGAIYAGQDPVLGVTYDGNSSVSSINMRMADRIVVNHPTYRVIVVPIAIAGTPYAAWVPDPTGNTSLFYRLQTAILRCRARGLEPDFIIWGQGETDNTLGTSAASVKASLWSIVDGVRALGCVAPFYAGTFTLNTGAVSAAVATGIANSVDAGRIIRAGYNADTNATVAGGYRAVDQTHLSNTGLTLVANGWADLILP